MAVNQFKARCNCTPSYVWFSILQPKNDILECFRADAGNGHQTMCVAYCDRLEEWQCQDKCIPKTSPCGEACPKGYWLCQNENKCIPLRYATLAEFHDPHYCSSYWAQKCWTFNVLSLLTTTLLKSSSFEVTTTCSEARRQWLSSYLSSLSQSWLSSKKPTITLWKVNQTYQNLDIMDFPSAKHIEKLQGHQGP